MASTTNPPVCVGELRERIALDRFTAGAWAPNSVVWARILPGPPPRIPEAAEVMASATEPGERLEVTLRYRSDLGDDARALRVRRGSDSLVVMQTVRDIDGRRRWSRLVCERFIPYATRHDAMLARVAAEGAPITFTKPTTSANAPGTYDALTDTPLTPPATTTVVGVAMVIAGGVPQQYVPGTLEQEDSLELAFVPNTYGEAPDPGALCTFGGDSWAVTSIDPLMPDGIVIGAKILVERGG